MGGEHCKIFPSTVRSKQPGSGQTPISAAISEGYRSGSWGEKFAGMIAGRESAAQEETEEKC